MYVVRYMDMHLYMCMHMHMHMYMTCACAHERHFAYFGEILILCPCREGELMEGARGYRSG